MEEGQRVLAVTAHPDDFELCCAGTVLAWLRGGWQARLVIATSGDKGSADRSLSAAEVIAMRHAEQAAAAAEMGLHDIVYLPYRDGELAETSALRRDLCRAVRRFRPHALFTHDPWRPYQLHPDHRALGFAALDAVADARGHLFYPEQIADGLDTWCVPDLYLFASAWPDTFIDVSATWPTKIRALQRHATQMAGMVGLEERLAEAATEHGQRIGARYAEAFKLMRVTIYPDL